MRFYDIEMHAHAIKIIKKYLYYKYYLLYLQH